MSSGDRRLCSDRVEWWGWSDEEIDAAGLEVVGFSKDERRGGCEQLALCESGGYFCDVAGAFCRSFEFCGQVAVVLLEVSLSVFGGDVGIDAHEVPVVSKA